MIDPPLTRGGKRSQISTITVRNTDTSETNIFWQLFRCISPCQPSGLSPRPQCNAAKAEVWFKKVCKHWWWQSCSNNMLCDFLIRRPIYCVFIITIFAVNSFTKRVLQIKQKTPKKPELCQHAMLRGIRFSTNDNIARLNNSFCLSCTSYSTYLARSASLRTKVQGEWGIWHSQPFGLWLCQMFTDLKNSFTIRVKEW